MSPLGCRLVIDRETGKPKGYGFCEYKDEETALSARRNLQGYEINGRQLRVDFAENDKGTDRNREQVIFKCLVAQLICFLPPFFSIYYYYYILTIQLQKRCSWHCCTSLCFCCQIDLVILMDKLFLTVYLEIINGWCAPFTHVVVALDCYKLKFKIESCISLLLCLCQICKLYDLILVINCCRH